MSSTRGGADPSDLYVTPAWAVDAILPHLPRGGVMVDIGCGDGAILSRLAAHSPASLLVGIELDEERAKAASVRVPSARVMVADWLETGGIWVDLAVSNPPFSLAEAFFEKAIRSTAQRGGTSAFLLRYNWGVPKCRLEFMRRHTPDVGWLTRRPDFVASLKCNGKTAGAKHTAGDPARTCGWKSMQRIADARPKTCPACGRGVTVVTCDSADYGWFLVGPGRRGAHFPIEIPKEVA